MRKIPENTGKNRRDKQGKFIKGISGNPNGKPKGTISITAGIKRELRKVSPKEKSSYLEILIRKILDKAVYEGDKEIIKMIWNHVDGLPRQSHKVQEEIESSTSIELKNIKKAVEDVLQSKRNQKE